MILRSFFIFCILGLFPITVAAQEKKAKSSKSFSFYLENDLVTGTDREYTNGIKLTWISQDLTKYREDSRIPEWSYPLIRSLPFVNEPGFQRAVSLSIGQSMFTPEDINRSDLISSDRPYTGITYLGCALHSKSSSRMDILEINLGLVGPHSYADECQKTIHRWIDSPRPNGWKNQLKDEPILVVYYERKWKHIGSRSESGFGYDFIPHIGGAIGNAFTGINAGGQIRLGWNLPNDFGTSIIRPGSDTNAPIDDDDPRFFKTFRRLGLHCFLLVDTHAVLRDISLDGNTFRDSHSVDKRPFGANFAAGLGFIIGRVKISYAYVYSTKAYATQKDEQAYGSITLTVTY